MKLKDFLEVIKKSDPYNMAEECLLRDIVSSIESAEKYEQYLKEVYSDYPNAEHIAIMGSGNWKFSLNPDKNFREFFDKSDIDIVIICQESFHETWADMREYHRKEYYFLPKHKKEELNRSGQNVYSGFISPKWIPNAKSRARFKYEIRTNNYSNLVVGFRKVNMMYFRNRLEVIDYYARGFKLAQNRI